MHVLLIGKDERYPQSSKEYAILEPETEEEVILLRQLVEKIARARNYRQRLPGMLRMLLPFLA